MADLVKLVHSAGIESRRKAVRPKALLDNCLKVMRMLYGVPCEWGCGEPSGMGVPCVGVLSHEATSVPSAQVVGSPPNAAEDPSLDAFSSPWSRGCFLCSASPQQSPFGGHQGRCKGGSNATPSGTKCHPPGTLALCMDTGLAPSEMPGTFCTGAGWGGLRHSLPCGQVAAGCFCGGRCCPSLLAAGPGHCPVPLGFYFFPQLSLNTR